MVVGGTGRRRGGRAGRGGAQRRPRDLGATHLDLGLLRRVVVAPGERRVREAAESDHEQDREQTESEPSSPTGARRHRGRDRLRGTRGTGVELAEQGGVEVRQVLLGFVRARTRVGVWSSSVPLNSTSSSSDRSSSGGSEEVRASPPPGAPRRDRSRTRPRARPDRPGSAPARTPPRGGAPAPPRAAHGRRSCRPGSACGARAAARPTSIWSRTSTRVVVTISSSSSWPSPVSASPGSAAAGRRRARPCARPTWPAGSRRRWR